MHFTISHDSTGYLGSVRQFFCSTWFSWGLPWAGKPKLAHLPGCQFVPAIGWLLSWGSTECLTSFPLTFCRARILRPSWLGAFQADKPPCTVAYWTFGCPLLSLAPLADASRETKPRVNVKRVHQVGQVRMPTEAAVWELPLRQSTTELSPVLQISSFPRVVPK